DHPCEYCLLPQDAEPFFAYHVEHIVARQHGRSDDHENLALACYHCNASRTIALLRFYEMEKYGEKFSCPFNQSAYEGGFLGYASTWCQSLGHYSRLLSPISSSHFL